MACQRRCRDVDVPHKAVVNCDALCSTFSDALRFVHLDMVNKLPQQRCGQLVHLHKLSDGSDKLVLIGRLPLASAICSRSCGIFAFKASCSTSYSWVICRKPSSERSLPHSFQRPFCRVGTRFLFASVPFVALPQGASFPLRFPGWTCVPEGRRTLARRPAEIAPFVVAPVLPPAR